MGKYRLEWEYIGIRGNEFGTNTIEAKSAAEAEALFCETNHMWKPGDFGFMLNGVEEVEE
jgi:hypothetical protein